MTVRIIGYTGTDKRKKYFLTEMGMDLKPTLEAIGRFGFKHFKGSKEYMRERLPKFGK